MGTELLGSGLGSQLPMNQDMCLDISKCSYGQLWATPVRLHAVSGPRQNPPYCMTRSPQGLAPALFGLLSPMAQNWAVVPKRHLFILSYWTYNQRGVRTPCVFLFHGLGALCRINTFS